MFLANPWGLVALAAVPAIVAIHYLRRRFRPLRVAGLFLWAEAARPRPAGRRWDRLPITASLLLELLAAAMLSVLLAEPRVGGRHSVRHLVVVLDDSASMSAGRAPGPSVRDRAIERLLERVEQLGPAARVTVLATGPAPRALLGPAESVHSPAQVRGALDAWRPGLPDHSPDPALALGRQLAGDDGRVLFLTDRLPDASDAVEGVEYLALGTPLANVGFVAARRDVEPGGGRCFLRLGNFSGSPAVVELVGRAMDDGPGELVRQSVELPARAERALTIDLPAGAGAVEFGIGPDELDADNRVILESAWPKPVVYRIDLPPGPLADAIHRAMNAILGTVLAETGRAADLVFAPADSLAGPTSPQSWRLLFGPLSGAAALEADAASPSPPSPLPGGEGLTTDGPFTIDRGAALEGWAAGGVDAAAADLLRDVTLDGCILAGIGPAGGLGLRPLISAGDRVVFGRVAAAEAPTWLFNADLAPTRSTLVRSVDWVILLSNLAAARRRAMPGLGERNFRLGDSVTVPLDPRRSAGGAGAEPLELLLPDGTRRAAPAPIGSARVLDDLPISGRYVLRSGDGEAIESFAVNLLDERQSDLTAASSGRLGGRTEPGGLMLVTEQAELGWLTALLLALAAAAILGNWRLVREANQ